MTATNVGIRLSVSGDAQVKGALGNVERSLGSVADAAKSAIGPLTGLFTAGAALGKMVAVQREFDVLNSSLKTVTGSSAAAAKEMEWIKQFAKETPFGLAQATQGFVKMKALGLDPSRAALTSFGNTAAAMGKDLNQMIEAVADASTGEFERLKEFGIKAKKEGDQVSLTFQGVTKTIGNNAAEITGYLEALGNNQFAGAMAERANTLDGAIASLADTWDELFRTISAQNAGALMHDAVRMAEGAVTDLTTILTALNGTTAENASQTGAMATVQEGLATAFEAVAVLGANVKYTLVQIGNELGGLAAQAVAVATGEFAQAAAIGRMMKADAEKARADVDATSARILGARAKAAQLNTLGAPNNYDEPATLRARAAGEKAIADAKASAAKAGDAASKKAQKAAEAELEWRRKTTLDMVKLWDDQAEAAQKAYDTARAGALKLADATEAAQAATTASLVDKLAAMRDEIDLIGLTTAQAAELNATKAEQIIADKEIELIMLRNADASVVQIQLLEQEIGLRRQLVTAMRTKAGKEASVEAGKEADKAADEAQKAWQKASEDIEKSLTDALMRGFESGKGFAEVLKDTVQNMFKTMVLRPIVSAVVSPVAGAITGSLGLAGAANAATGATSGLGALSTLGALGSGLGAGAGMIAGGGIGGWLSASTSLIGTGTAAGAMAGVGALAGPIGAVLAIGSLLKSLDDSGTYHSGGLGSYSAAGGASVGDAVKSQGLGFDLASKDYTASGQQAATAMAQAVAGILDSTAETFGQKAGYFAATAFADDTSKDGAWGALLVKMGDQMVIDWKNGTDKWPGREFANGEAGAKEYAAAVAKDVRDYLVTQVPDWADTMLKALGEAPTLEQLGQVVSQINQVQAALMGMGKASEAFAAMGEVAAGALIKAMGGGEAAAANLAGYYQNFYTEAERSAIATANLIGNFTDLGKVMPDSRDGLRGMIDAAIVAGDTTLAAGLLNLSDAFAGLTPVAEDAAAGLKSAIDEMKGEAKSLDRELLAATGGDVRGYDTQGFSQTALDLYDSNELKRAQIEAAKSAAKAAEDAAKAAIKAQEDAVKAQEDAARDAAQAAQAAWQEYAAAQKAIADEKAGLERQILEVQGDTAAIRALELAALDGSNRGLQERLWLLQDEKKVSDEAKGLQRQILDIQGDTTAIRALELTALQEANRPLLERIWLLQDEKKVADERKGLERQLLDAMGDTTAIRALERAELDEGNRWLYDRINALKDEKTATEKAKEASEKAAAAAEKLKSAIASLVSTADSTASKFLSGNTLSSFQYSRAAENLNGLGVGTTSGAQLQAASIGDIQAAVLQIVMLGNAAPEVKAQVLTLGAALIDLKQAAIDTAESATQARASQLLGQQKQVAELSGDYTTLVLLRQQEIDQMDGPLNKAMARYIDKLQEQARATEKEVSRQQQQLGLQRQIVELTGDKAGLAALRELEISQLDGPLNQALQRYIYNLQNQKSALEDAGKNTDAAYSALERATAAQRKTHETQRTEAQQIAQEIGGIFDTLKSNIRDLSGEVDSTKKFIGAAGQRYITASLAAARAGGSLPGGQDLADAISASRAAIDVNNYTSRAGFDRDKLSLIGQLSQLQSISGTQKSAAEQQIATAQAQLDALDQTLETAKTQMATLRDIDNSVIGVELAVSKLALAVAAESAAKAAADTSPATGGLANTAYDIIQIAQQKANQAAQQKANQAAEQKLAELLAATKVTDAAKVLADAALVKARAAHNAALVAEAQNPDTPPVYAAAAAAAIKANADYEANTSTDAVKLAIYTSLLKMNPGLPDGVKRSMWTASGLTGAPTFATGGAFTNGIVNRPTMFDMAQMGEAGSEAIMPLANIGGSLGVRYAGPDFTHFGRGMEAMAAEITALRAELQGLRAEARATAVNTGRTQDLLKRVSRNGEALQTEAAT